MLNIKMIVNLLFVLTVVAAIPRNDLIRESSESELTRESRESEESRESGESRESKDFGNFIVSAESGESVESVESVESAESEELQQLGSENANSSMHNISDTLELCRVGCPRILDPICAVDVNNSTIIKYFHNQCLMEFDSCRREKAWKPTHMLQCLTDVEPVIRDDCLRPCPFIYDPVCASNGEYVEIFGNQCIFGMENCLASGKWFEVRGEVCGL